MAYASWKEQLRAAADERRQPGQQQGQHAQHGQQSGRKSASLASYTGASASEVVAEPSASLASHADAPRMHGRAEDPMARARVHFAEALEHLRAIETIAATPNAWTYSGQCGQRARRGQRKSWPAE